MSKTPVSEKRKLIDELKTILDRPLPPNPEYAGVIDEKTNKPMYFDPWEIFPFYGNYSSAFHDMALRVLENLLAGRFDDEGLAEEMFREVLCNLELCDYGTSPRVCFPTNEFRVLLPSLIKKWREYYQIIWKEKS
jgi:hypothetical protein